MKIRLNRKRNQGLLILGVIVLVMALGLGGCACIEILKKIEKLEEKKQQQETNCPPDLVRYTPADKQHGDDEVLADGDDPEVPPGFGWTTNGATKIDTNWYNPALEDETGF